MRRVQPLNLEGGCRHLGIIVHEILHGKNGFLLELIRFFRSSLYCLFNNSALGFLHMQSSFDRDNYVEILYNNIDQHAHSQFRKMGTNAVSHMGGKYDFASIMHYGAKAFSKNGQITIKAKVYFLF